MKDTESLVGILITLYAIVPSIIITVMYGFLSTIEGDIACIEIKENRKILPDSEKWLSVDLSERMLNINIFVVISAKTFHLCMAYYLTQLFGALFSRCLVGLKITQVFDPASQWFFFDLVRYINMDKQDSFSFVMIFCSAAYLIYFLFYILYDVYDSLDKVFNHSANSNNVEWYKKKYCSIGAICFIYGILPLLLVPIYYLNSNPDESYAHLLWITLTIFHLLAWWLWMPAIYKPLTHLAYIKKNNKT